MQLFICFAHVLVGSAYKQLTMAFFHACNLLRPNNLSGDLTDDFVNNVYIIYLSLNKSPNCAMFTSL